MDDKRKVRRLLQANNPKLWVHNFDCNPQQSWDLSGVQKKPKYFFLILKTKQNKNKRKTLNCMIVIIVSALSRSLFLIYVHDFSIYELTYTLFTYADAFRGFALEDLERNWYWKKICKSAAVHLQDIIFTNKFFIL